MLIAFTGRARHGKTTAVGFLQDHYGFRPASFAEPLKRMCYEGLLRNPPPHACAADRLAQPWDSDRDYWQNRLWEDRTEFSRWLLQFVGTEIVRTIDRNYWARAAIRSVDPTANCAFADLRFENEAQAVREAGGIIVRVERVVNGKLFIDGNTNAGHASEAESAKIHADKIIQAETVEELHDALRIVMSQLEIRPFYD